MKKEGKNPTTEEIAIANENRKEEILYQATTKDVMKAIDQEYDLIDNRDLDYETQLKWAFIRAIELAKTPADALMVFMDECCFGEEEEILAFDKALELCKFKEDVLSIMGIIFNWEPDLEYERFFIKIFKRGHELPSAPDENNEENED